MRRILVLCLLFWALPVWAAEATVAVATNFKTTAERLTQQFTLASPQHQLRLVSGSTGKLYTQILHGAPFDIFLAADEARPVLLEQQGLAVPGSRRTYARGQLTLIGQTPTDAGTLTAANFRSLAMANPELAPYGLAAQQTLAYMNVKLPAATTVVYGENVGQAYALVASGNAELGFVARAQLSEAQVQQAWLVPGHYHEPILQQLVLLQHGAANPAAAAFLDYLNSAEARQLIQSFGYLTEPS